jgi:hypothetical protein
LEDETPQRNPGFAILMGGVPTVEEQELGERRGVFQRDVCENCVPPKPDANGVCNPIATGDFFDHARVFLERKLLRFAERYSSAAWLFYLRRLDASYFRGGRLATNEFYHRDLAEIISGLGGSRNPSPKLSTDPLVYTMDAEVFDNLKWFCAGVQKLKHLHVGLRTARKNVQFRIGPGGWPEPEYTDTQREAIRLYDDRNQRGSPFFIAPAGTVLGRHAPQDPDSILVVSRTHPVQRDFLADELGEGTGPVSVPASFDLGASTLDQVKELSHLRLGYGWNVEVGLLWMLLRLAKFMLVYRPGFVPSVTQYGYLKTDVPTLRSGQMLCYPTPSLCITPKNLWLAWSR